MSGKTFTAPDGKGFTDRKEYRKYMMETFYSFKNKDGDHGLVRRPGEIDGQPYDIADCTNCTIILMDITEQVQIDNLTGCLVFIGACSSTLFIRNCSNCTFFSCSRQLRLCEVTVSTFYSYCQSEIHMELCNTLFFAPFLGGYSKQKDHFASIGFDTEKNLWYDIYDHSDPEKTNANWARLEPSQYQQPWFPDGECDPCVPVTVAPVSEGSTKSAELTQVGETFSIQQMMADAERMEGSAGGTVGGPAGGPAAAGGAVARRGRKGAPKAEVAIETALLIATAETKSVNLSVWFNERVNGGVVAMKDFNNRLVSLASTLGLDQDQQTKQELELAVSKDALRKIADACGAGNDANGNQLINVTSFLQLCQDQVERYIAEMEGGGVASGAEGDGGCGDVIAGEEDEALELSRESEYAAAFGEDDDNDDDHFSPDGEAEEIAAGAHGADGEEDEDHFDYLKHYGGDYEQGELPGTLLSPQDLKKMPHSRYGDDDYDDEHDHEGQNEQLEGEGLERLRNKEEAEAYIKDIQAKAAVGTMRPKSAVPGKRALQRGEDVRETFADAPLHPAGPSPAVVAASIAGGGLGLDLGVKGAAGVGMRLPHSPYDEEVAFDLDDYDEDEELDSAYLGERRSGELGGQHTSSSSNADRAVLGKKKKKAGGKKASSGSAAVTRKQPQQQPPLHSPQQQEERAKTKSQQHWEAENRMYLMASSPDRKNSNRAAGKQGTGAGARNSRPSSAGPRIPSQRAQLQSQQPFTVDADRAIDADELLLHPERISRRMDHLARATRGRAGVAGVRTRPTRLSMRAAGGADEMGGAGVIESADDHAALHPPRASSAGPRQRAQQLHHSHQYHPHQLHHSHQSQQRGRRKSFSGPLGGGRASSATAPSRGVRSSSNRLAEMKDLVEDMVRSTVKKADLYHMIQVNLGFIESYTMIPPRGAIITSKKRDWFSNRELQTAFIAARLCLTEPQLIILKGLVHSFANQFDALYESRATKNIKIQDADGKGGGCCGNEVEENDDDEKEEGEAEHVLQGGHGTAKMKRCKDKGALGPGQTLSAEWLKKYLVHLRLTKKTIPAAAAAVCAPVAAQSKPRANGDTGDGPIESGDPTNQPGGDGVIGSAAGAGDAAAEPHQTQAQARAEAPLLWKEWLGMKMQHEVKSCAIRPREFEKALSGAPHSLNQAAVELLLRNRTNRVLPAEVLQQEVECRVESWLLDMDGRRDFPHEMNVHIRKWIWNKIKTEGLTISSKDKKGNWKVWQQLPAAEKQKVRTEVLNTIIKEKREALLASERSNFTITEDLYKQFDRQRPKEGSMQTPISWTAWLDEHLRKFKRTLEDFRRSEKTRMQRLAAETARRKSVAGLNEVRSKLLKAKDDYRMDVHQESELLRGIHALERAAAARGLAKGTLVCREDFDKHIKTVIVPFITFDDPTEGGGEDAAVDDAENNHAHGNTQSHRAGAGLGGGKIGRADLESLFHTEPKKVVEQVVQAEHARSQRLKKDFDEWLEEKNRVKEEENRKRREAKAAAEKEKKEKAKKNKKAMKEWMKLHKKNKYKSMVDRQTHSIPGVKMIAHKEKWNADKDLEHYYAEMEKRY